MIKAVLDSRVLVLSLTVFLFSYPIPALANSFPICYMVTKNGELIDLTRVCSKKQDSSVDKVLMSPQDYVVNGRARIESGDYQNGIASLQKAENLYMAQGDIDNALLIKEEIIQIQSFRK